MAGSRGKRTTPTSAAVRSPLKVSVEAAGPSVEGDGSRKERPARRQQVGCVRAAVAHAARARPGHPGKASRNWA